MKKKSAAHSGATGIRLTAFGYAMKARPGPETHTHTHTHTQVMFQSHIIRDATHFLSWFSWLIMNRV